MDESKIIEQYGSIMRDCILFRGIPEGKYPNVLSCFHGIVKQYEKDEIILNIGDSSRRAGVVLEGEVELSYYDEGGNAVNLRRLGRGDVFNAELALSGVRSSEIMLMALGRCRLLLLDFDPLLQPASCGCPHRSQVQTNLLSEFAAQTMFLHNRMRIISQRFTRDKIRLFLQNYADKDSNVIVLPFNRDAMADYLYVNRSALSRELSRMQSEGLLSYSRNKVTILDPDFLSA